MKEYVLFKIYVNDNMLRVISYLDVFVFKKHNYFLYILNKIYHKYQYCQSDSNSVLVMYRPIIYMYITLLGFKIISPHIFPILYVNYIIKTFTFKIRNVEKNI